MKIAIVCSLSLLLMFACSSQKSAGTIGYSIEKHQLNVVIDPVQSAASIEDQLSFNSPNPVTQLSFLVNKNIDLQGVEFPGQDIEFKLEKNFPIEKYIDHPDSADRADFKSVAELVINFARPVTQGVAAVRYNLTASDSVNKAAFSREYIAYEVNGYIGEKGVFLSPSYFWYPSLPNNLSRFQVDITCPANLYVLTQGKLTGESAAGENHRISWQTDYPTDGIHLVGSNYAIQTAKYRDIDIYTDFFPETQELAPSYLAACQRYLAMYEKMIGPYPFSKFAVVENFFPTGYGMPSYTLLGSQVLRLPFIIYTSLGHEITHNWWGNSVYVNYDEGNWCEGLTTYFADYHYKEMKSPEDAMQYRRDLDRDFTVYVKDGKDFPLSQFRERTESSSRAIGYGKSAMVFHQLRKIVGDSLFYQTFRDFYKANKFREASWTDIQTSANKVCQQDLDWFFGQWVNRAGAPQISLEHAEYLDNAVEFTLEQPDPAYRLYVPVSITENTGKKTSFVWFEKPVQTFQIQVAEKPAQLAVDPDFDLFRRLDHAEIPPTLSEIYGQDSAVMVLPDNCPAQKLETYRDLAEKMAEGKEHISIVEAKSVGVDKLTDASYYFFGTPVENSLIDKIQVAPQGEVKFGKTDFLLNGESLPAPDDLLVLVFRARQNPDLDYCIIALGKNANAGRVGMLLSHYGKYSYLNFSGGKNVIKDVYTTESSPLVYKFE